MTKAEGSCKINGIEVGEVSLSMFGPSPLLAVKYALTDITSGTRLGAGNKNTNWNEKVMNKLREFLSAVEEDICSDVFETGATTSSSSVEEVPQQLPFSSL